MSTFLSFSNEKRTDAKKQNPNMSNIELSKLLSQMWKDAPEEEKKIYIEREAEQREIYKKEIAKYRQRTKKTLEEIQERRENLARNIMLHRRQNLESSSMSEDENREASDLTTRSYDWTNDFENRSTANRSNPPQGVRQYPDAYSYPLQYPPLYYPQYFASFGGAPQRECKFTSSYDFDVFWTKSGDFVITLSVPHICWSTNSNSFSSLDAHSSI